MKNETNEVFMMAVSVVLISIVLMIISYTIYTGRDIGNAGIEAMDKIIEDTNTGTLRQLSGGLQEMPIASVYSIMNGISSDSIDKQTSSTQLIQKVGGAYISTAVLEDNLTGKGVLQVYKLKSGLYRVIVHHTSCSIRKTGTCNCTAETALRNSITARGLKW